MSEEQSPKTYYIVAIYWKREMGYGGTTRYETLEAAREEAARKLKLGYGDGINSEIHIIRKSYWLIDVLVKPQEAPHDAA